MNNDRPAANFETSVIKIRRQWNIFKVLRGNNDQS